MKDNFGCQEGRRMESLVEEQKADFIFSIDRKEGSKGLGIHLHIRLFYLKSFYLRGRALLFLERFEPTTLEKKE
jgi:hypothetical protein